MTEGLKTGLHLLIVSQKYGQHLLADTVCRFTFILTAQKRDSTCNTLPHMERKEWLTSWSYSRKTWKLRSLLSTGWEEIRWRKISCDDTVFLKTARYSLKGGKKTQIPSVLPISLGKSLHYVFLGKIFSSEVVTELLYRERNHFQSFNWESFPVWAKLWTTPQFQWFLQHIRQQQQQTLFKTETLNISYQQISCSPMRIIYIQPSVVDSNLLTLPVLASFWQTPLLS